jgi:hypothetical protein
MQPQYCYDDAPDDDGPCISLRTTDGTSEDLTAHSTPAIATPVVSSNIKDRNSSHEVSPRASRYSVAMSLEESFGNGASLNDRGITKCKSEDPEEGLMTILQKASTERTMDTRTSDEDDASAQTSRRGSATRSSDRDSYHKSAGSGTQTRAIYITRLSNRCLFPLEVPILHLWKTLYSMTQTHHLKTMPCLAAPSRLP